MKRLLNISQQRTLGGCGATLVVLMFVGSMLTPTVLATDPIDCTLIDMDGNPLSGEVVIITNGDTSDYTTVTTDAYGDCSADASTINANPGTPVIIAFGGNMTLSGCGVLMLSTIAITWQSGSAHTIRGFINPPTLPSVPTTLTLGEVSSDRTAVPVVVSTSNNLGWGRVQGNGAPWGTFGISAAYQLTDNENRNNGGARVYRFALTVNYLGWYDAGCVYTAYNPLPNADTVNSGPAAYANLALPYDSDSDQPSFSPQTMTGLPATQTAGPGANDKLMKIEVVAHIETCDGPQFGQGGCPGGLDYTAINTYYVEP